LVIGAAGVIGVLMDVDDGFGGLEECGGGGGEKGAAGAGHGF
jgi:hypothetical protein